MCRQWLEEKARNRFLEQRHAEAGTYEIEVKTGRMKASAAPPRGMLPREELVVSHGCPQLYVRREGMVTWRAHTLPISLAPQPPACTHARTRPCFPPGHLPFASMSAELQTSAPNAFAFPQGAST
jgi:hypothetical protein